MDTTRLKQLTETEKAYLAGLFDGEGCVNITKSGQSLIVRVMIVNTDLDVLEYVKGLIGGDITTKEIREGDWKPYRAWRTAGSRAINFLDDIQPYLHIKKKQAILAFCFSAIQPGRGHVVTPDIAKGYELVKNEMKWLNRRGVRQATDIEPISVIMDDLRNKGDQYAIN